MLVRIRRNTITPLEIQQFIGKTDLCRETIAEILDKKTETIDQWISGELVPDDPVLLRLALERIVDLYGHEWKELDEKIKSLADEIKASTEASEIESRAWREKLAQV